MIGFRIASFLMLISVILGQEEAVSVNLGRAAEFAILSKAGISTVPPSVIISNIGVSPIAATALTGFTLDPDAANPSFTTCTQVAGKIFAADYANPTPGDMSTAVSDMEAAYNDAAGRPPSVIETDGIITGKTFTPGVHVWDRDISFVSQIYIAGTPTDKFIFQTSGNVIAGSGA
jgi:hypothetical protein